MCRPDAAPCVRFSRWNSSLRSPAEVSIKDIDPTVHAEEVSSKDISIKYQSNCQYYTGLQKRHLREISIKLPILQDSDSKKDISGRYQSSCQYYRTRTPKRDISGRYQSSCQYYRARTPKKTSQGDINQAANPTGLELQERHLREISIKLPILQDSDSKKDISGRYQSSCQSYRTRTPRKTSQGDINQAANPTGLGLQERHLREISIKLPILQDSDSEKDISGKYQSSCQYYRTKKGTSMR